MPLPILAVVAARLGIRLATYMVGKQLKKGAAKKLRKAITKKKAEIAKKKEGAGKGFRGKGSKRKEEKVVQRKKKDKPKVDSGLSIKKKQTDKTKKVDKTKSYKITPESYKKKPMTQKQARHATRPQKKYETIWESPSGKKYITTDSDGSRAAAARGLNKLDRYDAPKQRVLPKRLPNKKGEVKELRQKNPHGHWSEKYK